jgi:pimeloyl-ACP methyl ester carboxylesterase
VHLVGHSYGGLVSRAAVIARPELFASLTLLCSGPAAIGGGRAHVMEMLRTQLIEGGVERVSGILRMAAGGASFETYRFDHSSPTALLGMGDALLSAADRVDELAAVLAAHAIPALVTCGESDDAWSPAVQEEMARRLGARFAAIPSAAHSPAIENPVACADLITEVSA